MPLASITSQKLGVLIFARKRPGFDQEWSRSIRDGALAAIAALGFEIVGAEAPVLDDDSVHTALASIEKAGCTALVVLQPSIADGQYAFTIMQRWAGPVVLWATPERPGNGKVSSCSLVGANMFASIFHQAGRAFELINGAPEGIGDELLRAVALTSAVKRLARMKVGVIGSHAPGFVDLAADPFLIQRTFGLQMHTMSLPLFIERVGAVPDDIVAADVAKLQHLQLPYSEPEVQATANSLLSTSARFYVTLRDLMKEFSLDGLSVQCWPELPAIVGQWPYLAVSRLSAEGEAISIEGDVDAAIQALLGILLGAGPGFLTDWLEHDDSTIQFWHPGMAPLDMCYAIGCETGPSIANHFNNLRPFVVDGPIRTGGPVTVSRLWRCDGRYHLAAFEGRAIPPRRHLTGNTLLVEVDGETVPQKFDRLVHEGLPHHVTVHFGNHADTFRRLARLLGIGWHES
jgi:L-fucose isomerase-like protein